MLLNGCGSGNNRVLEEVSEKVYAVEANANISIQNRDGAVLVYGSDANEMRVQAVKKAYSRERLNQIAIDVSIKPSAVSVTTKFPSQAKWALSDRSGTVDYTIVVPETASISALDLNAGEVVLDSMGGREVHARLGDGRIFARNCFTNLDLTVNRGTLALVLRMVAGGKVFGAGDHDRREMPGFGCLAKRAFICSPVLRMERSPMISIMSR